MKLGAPLKVLFFMMSEIPLRVKNHTVANCFILSAKAGLSNIRLFCKGVLHCLSCNYELPFGERERHTSLLLSVLLHCLIIRVLIHLYAQNFTYGALLKHFAQN